VFLGKAVCIPYIIVGTFLLRFLLVFLILVEENHIESILRGLGLVVLTMASLSNDYHQIWLSWLNPTHLLE